MKHGTTYSYSPAAPQPQHWFLVFSLDGQDYVRYDEAEQCWVTVFRREICGKHSTVAAARKQARKLRDEAREKARAEAVERKARWLAAGRPNLLLKVAPES